MIHHKKKYISVLLILLSVISVSSQENLLNYQNTSKYASYLFDNKIYDLAATEYERVVFLDTTDTFAKLRLVQSYRLMNDLQKARSKMDLLFPSCNNCCNEAFAVENFRIFFLNGQYDNCLHFLNENSALDSIKKNEFRIAVYLMQYNWKTAEQISKNYYLTDSTTNISKLHKISLSGETIRYKNPYLAATFSALIPGSGKIYSGQWQDGIYSFLVVSALSYLTYSTVQKNRVNPYTYIFGTAAFSFYSANIYGSFKSAIRRNKELNRNNIKDVEKLIFDKQKN